MSLPLALISTDITFGSWFFYPYSNESQNLNFFGPYTNVPPRLRVISGSQLPFDETVSEYKDGYHFFKNLFKLTSVR